MMSIAHRDCGDMTIWADGMLSSFERTPRLEWEWYDLFNAEPPDAPSITGETNGNIGTQYEYTFNAVDPDGDNVKYHIDWGDDSTNVTVFSTSGMDVKVNHTWTKRGAYTITAKAEDVIGAKSPEGKLTVTMPKNKPFIFNFPLLSWLFEQFPHALPILRYMLGL